VNLGVLYLCSDQVEQAHKAFSTAQALDPAHARAWIGQAYIAQLTDHAETLDLFRHSTQLNPLPQAAIAFAFHVALGLIPLDANKRTELYNKGHFKAGQIPEGYGAYYLAQANIALSKHVRTNIGARDACAWNIYGLLLEKQSLFLSAYDAFRKSRTILLDEHKSAQSVFSAKVSEIQSYLSIVSVNLARVSLKLNNPQESLALLESSSISGVFETCLLALNHFKLGDLAKSFQVG
jgi:superkiller protein 3